MSDVGRYRKLYPRLWRHPEFRRLPETSQRVALYALTGPQTNRIGIFYFSLAVASEDLALSVESIREALVELAVSFGWSFDSTARHLYIPSWWRWNQPDHQKVLAGNLKDLNDLTPSALVDAFAANLQYLKPELHETFEEACAQRISRAPGSQEQEQGAGIRSREQERGRAPRALRTKKSAAKRADVDDRVLDLVREVIDGYTDESADPEYIVDAVKDFGRRRGGPEIQRADILAALDVAIAERRGRPARLERPA